jgi:type VI secretion system VasD/TssJ family lipoprotein
MVSIFLVFSCASSPPSPPDWKYEKDAVTIQFRADQQLNERDGMAHTLLICVYQLRDPNTFNQYAGNTEGLTKLLECSLFDGSAVGSKRVILYPGQEQTILMDRAEGAKYLALVGGYFQLRTGGIVRLVDLPVIVEEKGWFRRTKISKPGPLVLEVTLGSQQIERIEARKKNE